MRLEDNLRRLYGDQITNQIAKVYEDPNFMESTKYIYKVPIKLTLNIFFNEKVYDAIISYDNPSIRENLIYLFLWKYREFMQVFYMDFGYSKSNDQKAKDYLEYKDKLRKYCLTLTSSDDINKLKERDIIDEDLEFIENKFRNLESIADVFSNKKVKQFLDKNNSKIDITPYIGIVAEYIDLNAILNVIDVLNEYEKYPKIQKKILDFIITSEMGKSKEELSNLIKTFRFYRKDIISTEKIEETIDKIEKEMIKD